MSTRTKKQKPVRHIGPSAEHLIELYWLKCHRNDLVFLLAKLERRIAAVNETIERVKGDK